MLRPIRWVVSGCIAFAVAWFTFMVPLGRFTLFEHMRRIFATDEAQELTGEIGEARTRLTDEVVRQVGEVARPDAGSRASGRAAPSPRRD